MAGPFDIFRRNQRALLVAVAILAMLAFFVLPPVLQQMGPSGASGNATVVRWSGGTLDESQLAEAVTMRRIVNRFLALAAAEAGRDTSRLPLFMPETEEGVVQAQLLRGEAAEQGVVISDEAINDFLARWTNNLVRRSQFDAILARLSSGPMAVGEGRLFEALRRELEARTMLVMSQTGYSSDTPAWRWDGFRRLEQAAIVEVVPIAADSLAAEVPAASEATLGAFFESYRESLPDPESPEPGFRVPHRIEADYLVALQKPFMEAAAKEVTDEQIQSYYDANKDRLFRAPARPASEPAKPEPAEPAKPEPAKPEPAKPEPAKPEPAKPEPAKPEPAKPEPAKPEPANPEPAKPEPAKPEPAKPGEPEAVQEKAAGRFRRSPFRFVADTPGAAADSKPADDTGPPEATSPTEPAGDAPVEPKQGDAAGEATKDGDKKQEQDTKQKREEQEEREEQEGKDKQEAENPDKKNPDKTQPDKKNEDTASSAPRNDPEPSYEPLSAVRDRIRDDLSREKAAARIEAIFAAVQSDLARYAEDLALWRAKGEGVESRPRQPDIDAIAKAQGLEARRTGVVDAARASDLSGIGSSFAFVPDPGSRFGVRQQSWLESMFANENTLRAVVTDDAEGNRYLSWKISDEPEHSPSFESAREAVEKAWRIVEARKLALEKAKSLAATVGGDTGRSTEPLEAALAVQEGIEILQAGPFTWLDSGMVAFGGRPQVSRVPGLELPGDAFMRTVFGLEPGGVGVAFNEPQTVCYCIRLVSLSPDEETLRKRFLESIGEQGRLSAVTIRDFTESYRDWIEGLDRKYAVTWKRPPR